MDLLQTVRKEGSRGGVNFSWDDVKTSSHRENYLGHSLMAPVGRWQKGKDLNWYAKAEDADLTPEERAKKEHLRKREELRKVKEAEEDAMNRALGLPVPDRTNTNLEPLGKENISQQEVDRAMKEALGAEPNDDDTKRRLEATSGSRVAFDATNVQRDLAKDSHLRTVRRRDRSESHNWEKRGYRDTKDDDKVGPWRRRSDSRSRDRAGNRQSDEQRQRHRRYRSQSRSKDRRHRSRSRERRRDDRNRRHRVYNERPRSREPARRPHRSRSRSPYTDRRRRPRD